MASGMTLNQFEKKFAAIKALGWVPSARRGPTGIGQTLEQLLGLKENNIAVPDLGKIELKAHRIGSSSLITLFTFNRKVWRMKPWEAIRSHGTPDDSGRLGMYYTMSRTPNSQGLFLHIEPTTISVRHISGNLIAEWELETLAQRFMQKLPALILVSAFSEMRGDTEWFRFSRSQLLQGTSVDIIRGQIYSENALFDIRFETGKRGDDAYFLMRGEELQLIFKDWEDI
ncbi:MAG TPA: MvaI/BcnI family restriction endonuclease [Anaerolineae bacterium]|nr:MvaI/BcnI family restriction endonuclease [Anaerolineae bacterium]